MNMNVFSLLQTSGIKKHILTSEIKVLSGKKWHDQ